MSGPGERDRQGVRVERYETAFGSGRLLLRGDLPLELELPPSPSGAAGQRVAGSSAPRSGVESSRREPDTEETDRQGSLWVDLLERYFAGERVTFPLDVEAFLAAHGFTDFARAVLRALWAVPYGTAVSYRDLAVAVGRPNAYRAVGSVMAKNPLPVILPCHRVLHNDGSYGNYGDDPSWKPRLLALEGWDGRHAQPPRLAATDR